MFENITFNKVKIFLLYCGVFLYGLLIFLKQNLGFDLGYYEILIVAFIGYLIKVSLGVPKEITDGISQLLTPTSKRKFLEFIDMKDDIKSIVDSSRRATNANIEIPELKNLQTIQPIESSIINEPFLYNTPKNSPSEYDIEITYDTKN